jgi:hypothetical protein
MSADIVPETIEKLFDMAFAWSNGRRHFRDKVAELTRRYGFNSPNSQDMDAAYAQRAKELDYR